MNPMRHRLAGITLTTAILAAPAVTAMTTPTAFAAGSTTMVTYYGASNVRTGASTSSDVVTTVPAGTQISGTVSGTWLKISSPSNLAGDYISTTVLHATSTTTTSTPTSGTSSASATRYTYYDTSNVRTAASTSAGVATTLSAGTKLTGTISGDWMKISTPSNLAGKYISTSILTATAPSGGTTTTTPSTNHVPTTGSYDGGVLGQAYTLSAGENGVKVYLLQKALGIPTSPMSSTMDTNTIDKLTSFQRNNGLPATGVLDQTTWDALGIDYPFTIDSWEKSSVVNAGDSHATKVNKMIAWTRAQLGLPYVWGGTGPMGYDCAGLLIQAARAGGMTVTGVSNFIDVRPASDLSNQMLHDSEFTKASLSNLQVGDFVYYGNSNGVAHHVSMYIGNNTVINAIGSVVQYSSLSSNAGWAMKLGANRIS